jgi:hypothetical protein
MKKFFTMDKFIVVALLALAMCKVSMASVWPPDPVPEIDPSSGMSALALIAGAVMVIRGRLKK